MKTLLIGSLLLSTTASFAQSIDLNAVKSLMTAKKATLEKVNAGMTKKVVTTAKDGECNFMMTSVETVLKIDGEKVYLLSKEKFQPQNSPACRTAGYTATTEQSILYTEAKPSIASEIADLDVFAQDIKAITRAGDLITMNISLVDTDEEGRTTTENITSKFDLSKPIFKYNTSSQSINFRTVTEEMIDVNLQTVDLKKVLFCDNNDGDETECVEGDFSDILF